MIDGDFEFTVEQVVARRIIKVKVRKINPQTLQEEGENGTTDK